NSASRRCRRVVSMRIAGSRALSLASASRRRRRSSGPMSRSPIRKASWSSAPSLLIGGPRLDQDRLRPEGAGQLEGDTGDGIAEQANFHVVRHALVDVQGSRVAVGGQQGPGAQLEQAVAVPAHRANHLFAVLPAEDRLVIALLSTAVDFVLDLGSGAVDRLIPSRGECCVALTLVGEGGETSCLAVRRRRAGRSHGYSVPGELGEECGLALVGEGEPRHAPEDSWRPVKTRR